MENPALKWWHVRWGLAGRGIFRFAIVAGKIIGVLGLVAAAITGAAYLNSPWLGARLLVKADPLLCMVPEKLPSLAQAPLSDASIDAYGFKFHLPNKRIIKTREHQLTTMVFFSDRGVLIVKNMLRDAEVEPFFSILKEDKRAGRLLENDVLQSRFKLMQAVLSATPDHVKWWRFRSSQNQKESLLLETKSIAQIECAPPGRFTITPVYTIAFGEFRGFQFGNPDVAPYEAHIDVFDGADRQFTLDIAGPEGHKQLLTQQELNAMVASIRPTSDR